MTTQYRQQLGCFTVSSSARTISLQRPSRRSVAEFSRLSFPPSATVPPIQNVEEQFAMCQPHPLLNLYDPPGIPLKPNLVSFLSWNLVLSNCCHKSTILLHVLAFWMSYLWVVQAKKGMYLICRQQPALVLHWWQRDKQRVFCSDVTRPQCKPRQLFKVHLVWNLQDFLWSDPGL